MDGAAFDNIAIGDLPLTTPVVNALRAHGVATAGVLRYLTLNDFRRMELPPGGLTEIRAVLASAGFDLGHPSPRERRHAISRTPAVVVAASSPSQRLSRSRFLAWSVGVTGVVALLLEELVEREGR